MYKGMNEFKYKYILEILEYWWRYAFIVDPMSGYYIHVPMKWIITDSFQLLNEKLLAKILFGEIGELKKLAKISRH